MEERKQCTSSNGNGPRQSIAHKAIQTTYYETSTPTWFAHTIQVPEKKSYPVHSLILKKDVRHNMIT